MNWNHGEWAIVILFGLIFIEGWTYPSLILSTNLRYETGESFFIHGL